MNKYTLFQSDIPNENYIILNIFPYPIGRVLMFDDPLSFAEYTNNFKGFAWVQIFPYKAVVAFDKTISGKFFLNQYNKKQRYALVQNMADFYLKEVIQKMPEKFKKYLF